MSNVSAETEFQLATTLEFMTAAAFEARLCPTWPNEIKKTKLDNNTEPAAGINFLLWPVRVTRYFLLKPCLSNVEKLNLNFVFSQSLILKRELSKVTKPGY